MGNNRKKRSSTIIGPSQNESRAQCWWQSWAVISLSRILSPSPPGDTNNLMTSDTDGLAHPHTHTHTRVSQDNTSNPQLTVPTLSYSKMRHKRESQSNGRDNKSLGQKIKKMTKCLSLDGWSLPPPAAARFLSLIWRRQFSNPSNFSNWPP